MDNLELSEAVHVLAEAVAQLQARAEAAEAFADAVIACTGITTPALLPILREQLLLRAQHASKMDHHQVPNFQHQIAMRLACIDALQPS